MTTTTHRSILTYAKAIDTMNNLVFSYNWNNKLECKAFTTLRLHNPKKYQVGAEFEVYLQEKGKQAQPKGRVIIQAVKTIDAEQINDFIAFIDTGYSRAQTLQILQRMYKQANPKLDLILCVKP